MAVGSVNSNNSLNSSSKVPEKTERKVMEKREIKEDNSTQVSKPSRDTNSVPPRSESNGVDVLV
jgi:hypothetical protein